jgi:hypothetical protein
MTPGRPLCVAALVAALALACWEPAPPGDRVAPETGGTGRAAVPVRPAHVARDGDRFTLRVAAIPAGDVLDQLAAAGDFTVRESEDAGDWRARPVALDLSRASLARAIHAVLADVPHHLHYEWESDAAPGGPPWPAAPVQLARVTVGTLYRQPAWRRSDARTARPGVGARGRHGSAADLDARDPDERARAVARLDPDGPELDALSLALRDDPSPAVRRTAARVLAGGRGLHTHPVLLEALDDPDPEVVVAVIEALEDAYDDHPVPEIRERVAESVQHRDDRIRAAARDFVEWVEE